MGLLWYPFGTRVIGTMSEGLSALKRGKALVMVERPSLPPPPVFTKEKVTYLRTSFGMTQREFSDLMVVSPKRIQSWEQGTRKPSGTARRVLEILQSPDKLEPVRRFRNATGKRGVRSAVK